MRNRGSEPCHACDYSGDQSRSVASKFHRRPGHLSPIAQGRAPSSRRSVYKVRGQQQQESSSISADNSSSRPPRTSRISTTAAVPTHPHPHPPRQSPALRLVPLFRPALAPWAQSSGVVGHTDVCVQIHAELSEAVAAPAEQKNNPPGVTWDRHREREDGRHLQPLLHKPDSHDQSSSAHGQRAAAKGIGGQARKAAARPKVVLRSWGTTQR